jgi:hypothetical protein
MSDETKSPSSAPTPPIPATQPSAPPPPSAPNASQQVSGPAIGLLITGIIGGIFSLASFFSISIGTGLSTLWWEGFPERYEELWEGAFGIGGSLVGVGVAALIIYAALKMRELSQWGLAVAASVLAMIPCISPCCIIGLPIGIWSLVVITKPEIKAAFH